MVCPSYSYIRMYIHMCIHSCIHTYMYIIVAASRQGSMSPARANAVLRIWMLQQICWTFLSNIVYVSSIYGNCALTDAPHIHKLYSMGSYKAQYAPLIHVCCLGTSNKGTCRTGLCTVCTTCANCMHMYIQVDWNVQ